MCLFLTKDQAGLVGKAEKGRGWGQWLPAICSRGKFWEWCSLEWAWAWGLKKPGFCQEGKEEATIKFSFLPEDRAPEGLPLFAVLRKDGERGPREGQAVT